MADKILTSLTERDSSTVEEEFNEYHRKVVKKGRDRFDMIYFGEAQKTQIALLAETCGYSVSFRETTGNYLPRTFVRVHIESAEAEKERRSIMEKRSLLRMNEGKRDHKLK